MGQKQTGHRRVAAAFRRYRRLGMETVESEVSRYERIRGASGGDREEERELTAADETLRLLACFDRQDCVRAVRALWMTEREGEETVREYAAREGCSPRSVFRKLAVAHLLWDHLMRMP